MDHPAVFEQGGIVRLRESAATQSHDLGGRAQFVYQRTQGRVLHPAEFGFAGLPKNLLDRPLRPSLDALVQIFERPAQMAAQGRAHAALCRRP